MKKFYHTVFYKNVSRQRTEELVISRPDEDFGTDSEIYTRTEMRSTGEPATICGSSNIFTVDDAIEATGFGKFQWKICLFTGLSWIGDAMEMMILSILGPQLHCEWGLPGYKVAILTSIVFIGMGIGSPLWGNVSDKYGRRTGLIGCMLWILYYGLLSSFAPQYGWIVTLRALVGFGIGGAPQAVTLYSEFLPVKARGICVMLIGVFWALGAVFAVVLALFVMPTLGWRWLLGLSVIPMTVFCSSLMQWLPESPRFDVLAGRSDKAMKTLEQIAKDNKKSLPQGRLISKNSERSRGRVKDLFIPQYRRTTLILWFIWFANAFCYYGIVLLTTEMYQDGDSCGTTQVAKAEKCGLECHYLTTEDYKDLLWTTFAEFPGVLVVLFAIDRIGRKRSMTLSFFMFVLSILPMYACIGRISLTVLIFVARAAISGGYQVVFVYTPEVFPTEVRALSLGTSSGFARLGALLTPFVAQVLLRFSSNFTLTVYWVCALLAGIAALLLPIETLGRSMEEHGAEHESGAEHTSSSQQVQADTCSHTSP